MSDVALKPTDRPPFDLVWRFPDGLAVYHDPVLSRLMVGDTAWDPVVVERLLRALLDGKPVLACRDLLTTKAIDLCDATSIRLSDEKPKRIPHAASVEFLRCMEKSEGRGV